MDQGCYTTGSAKSSGKNPLCRCSETTAQVDLPELPELPGAVPGVLVRLVAGGFALAAAGDRLRVMHPEGRALPDDLRQAVKSCRGALLDLLRAGGSGTAEAAEGGRGRLARVIWGCRRGNDAGLARLLLDLAKERAAICEIGGGLGADEAWAVAADDAELALGEGWYQNEKSRRGCVGLIGGA